MENRNIVHLLLDILLGILTVVMVCGVRDQSVAKNIILGICMLLSRRRVPLWLYRKCQGPGKKQ